MKSLNLTPLIVINKKSNGMIKGCLHPSLSLSQHFHHRYVWKFVQGANVMRKDICRSWPQIAEKYIQYE